MNPWVLLWQDPQAKMDIFAYFFTLVHFELSRTNKLVLLDIIRQKHNWTFTHYQWESHQRGALWAHICYLWRTLTHQIYLYIIYLKMSGSYRLCRTYPYNHYLRTYLWIYNKETQENEKSLHLLEDSFYYYCSITFRTTLHSQLCVLTWEKQHSIVNISSTKWLKMLAQQDDVFTALKMKLKLSLKSWMWA